MVPRNWASMWEASANATEICNTLCYAAEEEAVPNRERLAIIRRFDLSPRARLISLKKASATAIRVLVETSQLRSSGITIQHKHAHMFESGIERGLATIC